MAMMCRVLGVSRAGFYAWQRRAPSDRDLADAWLLEKIRDIHAESKGPMGRGGCMPSCGSSMGSGSARSAWSGLWPARALGLARAPAAAHHDPRGGRQGGTGPRRARLQPEAPNRTWSADITYIRTWEGWLFLSHVQDLFSRRIVGWAMPDHLRQELVIAALEMAIARRKPDPG